MSGGDFTISRPTRTTKSLDRFYTALAVIRAFFRR